MTGETKYGPKYDEFNFGYIGLLRLDQSKWFEMAVADPLTPSLRKTIKSFMIRLGTLPGDATGNIANTLSALIEMDEGGNLAGQITATAAAFRQASKINYCLIETRKLDGGYQSKIIELKSKSVAEAASASRQRWLIFETAKFIRSHQDPDGAASDERKQAMLDGLYPGVA